AGGISLGDALPYRRVTDRSFGDEEVFEEVPAEVPEEVVVVSSPSHALGPEQRAVAWERLGAEQFDVVVIGGGVVGCGCALDAATRGLKVGLVEGRGLGLGTLRRSA